MKQIGRRFPIWALAAVLLAGAPAPLLAQGATTSSPADFNRMADALKPGQWVWAPEIAPAGPLLVYVDLSRQVATVYRNGVRFAVSTVSTGKPGHETPTGVFTILQKDRNHHSSKYNNAAMPWQERLTWDGVALHAGGLPGYPESHGCVHLPMEFAKLLFGETGLGGTVIVAGKAGQPQLVPAAGVLAADAPGGVALAHDPLAPDESFLAAATSSTLTTIATPVSGGTLTALSGLLDTGEIVLGGWALAATGGYASGDPAYLSFAVGPAQLRNDLEVWQYNGTSWALYAANDLTYDRTYASLTVTAMGIYAVIGDLVLMGDANRDGTTNGADLNTVLSNYNQDSATWAMGDFDGNGTVNGADLNIVLSNYNQSIGVAAAVPEPSTLVILGISAVSLLICARRRRLL